MFGSCCINVGIMNAGLADKKLHTVRIKKNNPNTALNHDQPL